MRCRPRDAGWVLYERGRSDPVRIDLGLLSPGPVELRESGGRMQVRPLIRPCHSGFGALPHATRHAAGRRGLQLGPPAQDGAVDHGQVRSDLGVAGASNSQDLWIGVSRDLLIAS